MESNTNQVQNLHFCLYCRGEMSVEVSEKVWFGDGWAGQRVGIPGVLGPGVLCYLAAVPTVIQNVINLYESFGTV